MDGSNIVQDKYSVLFLLPLTATQQQVIIYAKETKKEHYFKGLLLVVITNLTYIYLIQIRHC